MFEIISKIMDLDIQIIDMEVQLKDLDVQIKDLDVLIHDFEIISDRVKANFEIDLYDITSLETKGNSTLNAIKYGVTGKGDEININIKSEEIIVRGKDSFLNLQETKLSSDGSVKVNNLLGTFELRGANSNLQDDELDIYGEYISGVFSEFEGKKEIKKLIVEDENLLTINTENLEMNAKKAVYDDQTNIIELFSKVKIVKGQEIITGDYGYFDTIKNSYKVKSDNTSKVKVTIKNSNE